MKIDAKTAVQMLTLAALTTLAACSLPEAGSEVEGPDLTLDTQTPVAAFEVTLCMEGPKMDAVYPHAYVQAQWTAADGVAVAVTGENLDAMSPSTDTDDNPYLDEGEAVAEGEISVRIDTDGGPWGRRSGRRCQEPQVVQFDAPRLADGQSVELTWTAHFGGDYDAGAFNRASLRDEHFIIEIDRL